MADRCLEHPWGTCDRCGDDLQVQSACVSFGGHSTPCDRCVQEMLEKRRKVKERQSGNVRRYTLEVEKTLSGTRVILTEQARVLSAVQAEDTETALRSICEHICSLR